MNQIITISREFGSGGREIGRRLAEALGYAYYDTEIFNELSKRTAYAKAFLREIDQSDPLPLMPITIAQSFAQTIDPVSEMNRDIFERQCELIRELADKSNCVIVGRAADYILRDEHHLLRLFILADDEFKLARCREKGEVDASRSDRQLCREIVGVDKRRARYYEFWTQQNWGDPKNYDLCINTTRLGIKPVVKMLQAVVNSWQAQTK